MVLRWAIHMKCRQWEKCQSADQLLLTPFMSSCRLVLLIIFQVTAINSQRAQGLKRTLRFSQSITQQLLSLNMFNRYNRMTVIWLYYFDSNKYNGFWEFKCAAHTVSSHWITISTETCLQLKCQSHHWLCHKTRQTLDGHPLSDSLQSQLSISTFIRFSELWRVIYSV